MTSPKARTAFLLVLLFASVVLAFLVLRPFITTIALAAVFAVILYPLYKTILTHLRSRTVSALLSLLIGCVVVIVPVTFLGTIVVNEARSAYGAIVDTSVNTTTHQIGDRVAVWISPYVPDATQYVDSITAEIQTYVRQVLQWFIGKIGVLFGSILSIALHLLIFLMALYYFLKEGSVLEKLLIKKSPMSDEQGAVVMKQLSQTINSVGKVALMIVVIQGTLAGIGYFMFGVPSAAIWGVCTSVAALIPGVGTSLVIAPAVIYLFAVGNITGAVGLLLWGVFLVGLIDNFLAPRLMGKDAQLHPLAILLSILGGVAFYGPAGIFLGPLTLSFLLALYTVYAAEASNT